MIFNAMYIVLTYFESFTGYEDDIFEDIFNLHFKRCKFGGTMDKFPGFFFNKLNSVEFMEFVFFKVWERGG